MALARPAPATPACGQLSARSQHHAATAAPLAAPRKVSRRQRRAAAALPPLADAAASVAAVADAGEVQPWLVPAAGLGLALAGVTALRLSGYSQLEYITAAMLARHVKPGDARVLQLGGTTRDLFYYPAGTVQVTVGGPDVAVGLWEQAGMQAKVPVRAVKAEAQKVLSSQAGSSADSLVLIGQPQLWGDGAALLGEAQRVLKPGGTLVFVQRLRGGPLQPLLGGGGAVDEAAVEAVAAHAGWDFVQWDAALQGTDPHAVGVAVKPLGGAPASVDAVAFEQLMRRGKGGKQQARQAGFGGKP